jgi:site-specific recombinase XerD
MATSVNNINPALAYINSLSNNKTIKAMKDGLLACIRCFDATYLPGDEMESNWWAIRQDEVNTIRDTLSDRYAPATVNLRMAALRGVWEWCWRLGYVDKDTYEKLVISDIKNGDEPPGRCLSIDEIHLIFNACDLNTGEGIRNRAMLALAIQCGFRRGEITNLKLSDYHPDENRFNFTGKGSKNANVYISGIALDFLNEYLSKRGYDGIWLFQSCSPSGKLQKDSGLGSQGFYDMLRKVQTEAGINHLSPHDLRRTFITMLLDAGIDIVTVSKMARHSSVEQTKRYDRRPESYRKEMFKTITF